jgi:phage terminase large subunit-like protein
VCDFAELVGEPLHPWQRFAVIHALETVPGGGYRFGTILILVARQNGKSHLKRMITLWRLYLDGARLTLGVAQDVSLAREQWQMALDTIHASPDLSAELDQVRRVNGDEWFKLQGGGRYKIAASNRKAGRGLSIDELNIDELREQRSWDAWSALSKTTMARPRAQIWAMSNAGDDESIVLNQLRERALADPGGRIGIFEWSAPDGCDLDDTKAWTAANPGLGHTVSEQAIRLALATDPPNVFRTEVLCQKVDQLDGAVDYTAWQACADEAGRMDAYRDRLAACFDMAPDGQHATLAVAAITSDGRPRVEVVQAWDSSDTARAELGGWLDRIDAAAVGWFPAGPAGAFAPILRARPGSTELTGGKVAELCQGLGDLAKGRNLLHADQALLNAHIKGASKLPSGDGWRFTRRGGTSQGHVDAAYAAAGAIYIAQTMPEPQRASIRIVG